MTAEPVMSPTPAPRPQADSGPRINGFFDLARPDRVSGWAIDRADAAAAVDVEIRREGKLVATVRADRHRPDLEKGGLGTGNYGFSVDLATPVEPGFEFTITASARAADNTTGDLKRGGGKSTPVAPEQRVIERLFEEVLRLGETAAPPPPAASDETLARLGALVDRVEMTQLRLETALAGIDAAPARTGDTGLRAILYVTTAIALGSLGLGLYSLLLA